ncbi:DUF3800 domain-containing protein [Chryseobacterium sp. ISL-6]|uniref:DUF3800 domain-containing protein n=1 Tax=Chryseobacterium sp. ISL-6 TaxID=2819143 RepID=UPI001BE884AD|nr:DUF3800 domain-containing protein [Chryseobacterium sp. ISL-6]MBT2619171.1 hypothetical protein [Chryseobacterium sp. ISL-6]
METKELRSSNIEMFNLKKLDKKYKFYYDETNNIRRYYLKEDSFNESIKTNFILGGIVLENDENIDTQSLFSNFKLQHNVKEVKLKHIAKGDFLNCLKSNHLSSVFEFLKQNNIAIHYSSLNFLYFSIVDIIDSLLIASKADDLIPYNRLLKNNLYICVKKNITKFISVFFNYDYPNLKENKVIFFLDELIKIYELEPPSLENGIILMLLKNSKETKNLYFIMDEKNHELITDFQTFYLRTIYLFINSEHLFDNEVTIEELLNQLNLTYDNKKIENYKFIDSTNNQLIQLSDILIGFIGKLYNYINDTSINKIKLDIKEFSEIQISTLQSFYDLLSFSENKNKAFIYQTVSNDELIKIKFLEDSIIPF